MPSIKKISACAAVMALMSVAAIAAPPTLNATTMDAQGYPDDECKTTDKPMTFDEAKADVDSRASQVPGAWQEIYYHKGADYIVNVFHDNMVGSDIAIIFYASMELCKEKHVRMIAPLRGRIDPLGR